MVQKIISGILVLLLSYFPYGVSASGSREHADAEMREKLRERSDASTSTVSPPRADVEMQEDSREGSRAAAPTTVSPPKAGDKRAERAIVPLV